MRDAPLDLIVQYHEETKHHSHRFARSLGYLDWATQPNPFRSFEGAPAVDLVEPLLDARSGAASGLVAAWPSASFDEVIERRPVSPVAPGRAAVSIFLRFSLGLSAWKQAGPTRWALRVNPSSGNLHPTEGYVVLGPDAAVDAGGVFHYTPDSHALERRATFDAGAWRPFAEGLPAGAFLAGLTSIHWREAWKYGERAFRYCQHDIGHAIAAMSVAAAMMGWRCRILPGWSSAATAALLGLDRKQDLEGAEPETPGCLLLVSPAGASDDLLHESTAIIAAARAAPWTGRANRLSSDHVEWEWIDAAAEATSVPEAPGSRLRGNDDGWVDGDPPWTGDSPGDVRSSGMGADPALRGSRASGLVVPSASLVLLQRRSAVAMDGSSSIDRERFLFMLRRALPLGQPPFDALWWTPRIHLVLFVHRVTGLAPGLYALPRSAAGLEILQRSLHPDFAWIRPDGVSDDLPLFLLSATDVRRIARQLSCTQDIAADGFFSLGMLAEFEPALHEHGAWFYRNLFWEAGTIGQALYLEAEAAGCRATGIGCFLDDGVHEVLGVRDRRLQSLYHFTVGMPVDDPRLLTRPGYPWE